MSWFSHQSARHRNADHAVLITCLAAPLSLALLTYSVEITSLTFAIGGSLIFGSIAMGAIAPKLLLKWDGNATTMVMKSICTGVLTASVVGVAIMSAGIFPISIAKISMLTDFLFIFAVIGGWYALWASGLYIILSYRKETRSTPANTDGENLTDKAVNFAIAISLTIGMVFAPLTAAIILFFLSYLDIRSSDAFMFLPFAPLVTTVIIPLVAPQRLRRWTRENRPVIANSVATGLIVTFGIALIGFIAGWRGFWNVLGIGLWYSLWIGTLYVVSLRLIQRSV